MSLHSVELEEVDWIKGVAVPRGVRFRQLIVTGPPGSGKSSLIQKLGGWPEEGCIDLAMDHWWRNRVLAFRPREVHFSIPFKGFRDSHTVFDREWLAAPTAVDYGRIWIPSGRIWFFSDQLEGAICLRFPAFTSASYLHNTQGPCVGTKSPGRYDIHRGGDPAAMRSL